MFGLRVTLVVGTTLILGCTQPSPDASDESGKHDLQASCVDQGDAGHWQLCEVELEAAPAANGPGAIAVELPGDVSSAYLHLYAPMTAQNIDDLVVPLLDGTEAVPTVIYDADAILAANINPRSIDPLGSLFSMLVPNDPDRVLAGGKLAFQLSSSPAQEAHLLVRTGPPVDRGRVELVVHSVGEGNLVAGSPELAAVIESLEQTFCAVGVEVQVVEVRELDPRFGFVSVPTGLFGKTGLDELHDEIATRTEGTSGQVHAVIISGFSGGDAIGMSWAPGPYRGGNPLSAFILAAAGRTPQAVASVLGHELGHYLGLYHTRELDTETPDPIADTDGNDPANLMYPTQHGLELTEGQGRIIRRHPSVIPLADSAPSRCAR